MRKKSKKQQKNYRALYRKLLAKFKDYRESMEPQLYNTQKELRFAESRLHDLSNASYFAQESVENMKRKLIYLAEDNLRLENKLNGTEYSFDPVRIAQTVSKH